MNQQFLYWAFQSVHDKELVIGSKEDISFRAKYKKNYESRELYSDEEVTEKYKSLGWRNPLYSRITSLILAKEFNGELVVDYIVGEEKDLLQTFYNKLKNKHSDCQLVHFDASIVLPYIGVRFDKNGFNPQHIHTDLKYQGHNFKPWNLTGIDIKEYYKGAGDYSFSLEDIANIKGIDYNFIHYDSEYTYYHNEQFDSLKNSAINKIVTLSRVHRHIFELPQIEYKLLEDFVKNVEQEKPTNWLHELEKTNKLTLEIANGIKNQIMPVKKRLSKKDKDVIFETIKAVYVRDDFEHRDQDSKKVIAEKETEINNLISGL
jgi:hypothetical protein